jgi:peptide/nickel transport system permease protein
MLALALRRVGLSLLVLLLLSAVVFLGTEVLPGDALTVSLSAEDLAFMPRAQLDAMRAALGLDRPVAERYLEWLLRAVRFDFGRTLVGRAEVAAEIGPALLNSLLLGIVAALVTPVLAVLLGTLAALHPGGRLDGAISAATLLTFSIPEFVLGNLLIIAFAVLLPVFPAVIALQADAPWSQLAWTLPLPVAALTLGVVAHQVRLLRAAMIEALASEYVERAALSGLGPWRVVLLHALPVALLPLLNLVAAFVASLVSGIVVIEVVFRYPGIGTELVEGLAKREVAIVQAVVLLAAALVVLANLLADLALLALDPRARARAAS